MSIVEITGYAATALNIAGNLMLTQKSAAGWIVRLITNIVYIVYALQVDQGLPVVANHAIFIGINTYGWWRWRQQEREVTV